MDTGNPCRCASPLGNALEAGLVDALRTHGHGQPLPLRGLFAFKNPMTQTIVHTRNSIVFGNTAGAGPECATSDTVVQSFGFNLFGPLSGCAVAVSNDDIQAQDPQMGPLANNGGPTSTHAIGSISPAIDAGNPAGCLAPGDVREVGADARDGPGPRAATLDPGQEVGHRRPALRGIRRHPALERATQPARDTAAAGGRLELAGKYGGRDDAGGVSLALAGLTEEAVAPVVGRHGGVGRTRAPVSTTA